MAGRQAQPAGPRPRSCRGPLSDRRAHGVRAVRRLRSRHAARGAQPRLSGVPPLRGRSRSRVKAIDFHVHLSTVEWMVASLGPLREATERHFRTEVPIRTVDEMAEEFRADDVLGVLLAWDAESAMGLPPLTNDFVADCVHRHPDAFVGFASVDPWKGKAARDELRRAVTDLGLCGLKLHPSCQGFAPNERRFYDLWETV